MKEDNDLITVEEYNEWVSAEESFTAQIEELRHNRKAVRKMIDAADTLDKAKEITDD